MALRSARDQGHCRRCNRTRRAGRRWAAGRYHRTEWRHQSRRRSAEEHRHRRRRNAAPCVARRAGGSGPFRGSALPETLRPTAPFCVAIDPLDGSANLDNNISVGTIFSIRPRGNDILSTFFEPGTAQCAAGLSSTGRKPRWFSRSMRASIFSFSTGARREFLLIGRRVRSRRDTPEFAINASNRRHWHGGPYSSTNASPAPRRTRHRLQHALDRSLVAEAFASWCAAASSSIRPTRGRAIGRAGCDCCMKPIRSRSDHGMGGRAEHRAAPDPGRAAKTAARADALVFGLGARSGRRRALSPGRADVRQLATRRFCAPRPVSLTGERACRERHPIISITGSSGAGTTSVKKTFEKIFRREKVDAAYHRGRRFPSLRPPRRCARKCRRRPRAATGFQPFRPRDQSVRRTGDACFATTANAAPADTRITCTTTRGEALGAAPGTFTAWQPLPHESRTSCSTRACTAPSSPRRSTSPGMPISRSAWCR